MKVLIAHDRAEIASIIEQVCYDAGVDNTLVQICEDGTSARKVLTATVFDLLIIDLTLPHIKGVDEPSYQTVDLLLKELVLLADMKTPGDIIGITRDADAASFVATSIGPHVMVTIEEDEESDWRRKLKEKIQYAIHASDTRYVSANARYDYDIAIVTALDKELEPFKQRYDFSEFDLFGGAHTFTFSDKNGDIRKGVAFSVGKSGEARAASSTQSLIAIFKPRLLMMTGICGGVEGKVSLGDIIFAESAIDWDYGKWEEPVPNALKGDPANANASAGSGRIAPTFVSRPDPVSIRGRRVHRLVRQLLSSTRLKEPAFLEELGEVTKGKIVSITPHLAPMASGSSVIASDAILSQICLLNDSIRGIDMECFGVYYAADTTHVIKPEVVCIKSVSDFSNGTKGDEWHPAACAASARIATMIAEEMWEFVDYAA